MADYIPRPGDYDLSLPAPYHQKGANVRVYVLAAQYSALKATVDRYLNAAAPAGLSYQPLGNRVAATFMSIKEIRCAIEALGSMHEVDCAFFIPLIRWQSGLPSGVAFFPLDLFVNNSWAMATGREVHGFRKDLGVSFSSLDVNDELVWSHQAKDLTHIDTWTIDPRDAASRLKVRRIVELTGPATAGSTAWSVGGFVDTVLALMGDLGPLGAALAQLPVPPGYGSWLELVAEKIVEALSGLGLGGAPAVRLPIVFLRQFRDPRNSQKADLQEVLEAEMEIPLSSIGGQLLTGSYVLHFYDTASHPLALELGVSAAEPSTFSVQANLDFRLLHAV